ncbi:MAG: hypothetical protein CTY40_10630, partial [Hyphomicrobium sp.]
SRWATAYEQSLGDVRCIRRLTPKAVHEYRNRQARAGRDSVPAPDKQTARPSPLTVIGIPACAVYRV